MIRIRYTNHDPETCCQALGGARLVIVDLETTGLRRHDTIVAAGLLIDRDAHVLITRAHRDLSGLTYQVNPDELRHALSPLTRRSDLIAVFHNAMFDVPMLERAGIPVNCVVHDTMKLLKLYDSDRGRENNDGTGSGSQLPRYERRHKASLNYRLKDLARHLLNFQAIGFPGNPATLHATDLIQYLKSDLLVTRELYGYLQRVCDRRYWEYNSRLIAPVTPILVCMSLVGVQADPIFIHEDSERLVAIMADLSNSHAARFGQRLDVGDFRLRGWVYFDGLRCRQIRSGKRRQLSLRSQDLLELRREERNVKNRESLELIHDYKLLQSLMVRLRSLGKHVDRRTSRIYSTFNDFQSSGRVSSSHPNLQQIAGLVAQGTKKAFLSPILSDTVVRSRNAIVASPGHVYMAFDIAQADIRVLANDVESFHDNGGRYLDQLQAHRLRRLRGRINRYRARMWQHFQPENRKVIKCPHCWSRLEHATGHQAGSTVTCPACRAMVEIPARQPIFDPSRPCGLAEDFRKGGTDFYTIATERMLGRPPRNKTERNHMKQTILGIVNGMSGRGLAKRLEVDVEVAKGYLEAFATAYPQVSAYQELTRHAFAVTGESWTFGGHHRRITPHWWMVTKPVVDLFVSYKGADKLWLRVVPLRPNRFTLTCWVLQVIDAKYGSPNEGQEIYHHRAGRISQAPYKFFQDSHLVFRLPVRNVPWRMIRHVRTKREEARYEGYDKTWRQLFNHVAQGGTADIAKTMMIRCHPVCRQFDAHLLLQIHDELVFEVPKRQASEFARTMQRVLLEAPSEDFRVPIVLEPKAGQRFGDLVPLGPAEMANSWWIRWWHGWWVPNRNRLWAYLKCALTRARTPALLIMRRIWGIWWT